MNDRIDAALLPPLWGIVCDYVHPYEQAMLRTLALSLTAKAVTSSVIDLAKALLAKQFNVLDWLWSMPINDGPMGITVSNLTKNQMSLSVVVTERPIFNRIRLMALINTVIATPTISPEVIKWLRNTLYACYEYTHPKNAISTLEINQILTEVDQIAAAYVMTSATRRWAHAEGWPVAVPIIVQNAADMGDVAQLEWLAAVGAPVGDLAPQARYIDEVNTWISGRNAAALFRQANPMQKSTRFGVTAAIAAIAADPAHRWGLRPVNVAATVAAIVAAKSKKKKCPPRKKR